MPAGEAVDVPAELPAEGLDADAIVVVGEVFEVLARGLAGRDDHDQSPALSSPTAQRDRLSVVGRADEPIEGITHTPHGFARRGDQQTVEPIVPGLALGERLDQLGFVPGVGVGQVRLWRVPLIAGQVRGVKNHLGEVARHLDLVRRRAWLAGGPEVGPRPGQLAVVRVGQQADDDLAAGLRRLDREVERLECSDARVGLEHDIGGGCGDRVIQAITQQHRPGQVRGDRAGLEFIRFEHPGVLDPGRIKERSKHDRSGMRATSGTLRMIDAAGNRACEGCRVLEDIARFTLDDRELTERLKRVRHTIRIEIDAMGEGVLGLLASRDTPGDVGTDVSTEMETTRVGLRDVALAAGKRCQEALRTLEEVAKTLARSGKVFESSRYAMYELERTVVERLAPQCPQWSLCVLVTADLCTHHTPERVVELAAEGGADCVQIREKSLEGGALLDRAGEVADACRRAGIHVIVNDRPDIARLIDADGVHVGQTDLPIDAVRAIIGTGKWIGVSCGTHAQAIEAVSSGADVCGLGPMFASTTKTKPTLAGVELVRAFAEDERTRGIPHLAISGITSENVDRIALAGGRGVAVSSAVCGAEDPAAVCRAIIAGLGRGLNMHADATMPA